MEIIHISDNSYNLSHPLLFDKPDELIEKINKKHPDPDLFLINVNYKTQTIARADNAGILFLKFLRLYHFNQHCVLYSFLCKEDIMTQDPYNSIFFSGGITFVRMPDDLSKINYKLLATKRAPDDLSNFFKAEFRLPDNRHFFANWWGVLQLWKVQQAVEAITGASIAKSIESGLTASIREMNSYDGLVARYIKGAHEKDIEKTLRTLMAEKEELSTSNSFITEQYNIKNNRDVLAEETPSILFVDDQANDGWATIFQRIIYGQNCDKFSVIQPRKDESIEDVVRSITNIITKRKIKLLMLDLRLKGESGNNYGIDEISGIQVLRELSEVPITCPVLIISASNKIWSYRETLKLNADAYWIKEGLDDNISLQASIENYMRLVYMVYALCFNEEYQYLYHKLLPAILEIYKSESQFWWEQKFWEDEKMGMRDKIVDKELVNKETIMVTLRTGFNFFKMYLMERLQKDQTLNLSKHMASLVIIQFSRVLEIIHKVKSNSMYSLSEKMSMQLPSDIFWGYSKKLTQLRNTATHQFSGSFGVIKEFIDVLIEYLFLDEEEFQDSEPITSFPMHEECYTSEIIKILKDRNIVYLSNPNLALKDGRRGIILKERNFNGLQYDNFKEGTKIKYKLNIIEKKTDYYASEPSIVEE